MTNEIVKGFNDVSGEEALKRERINEIIVGTFKIYGFEPAETPVVEYEDFVKGENLRDEAVSDIFKLQDKGKRNLALRYEFTFQLKRLARNKKLPYKRYQIGEVFRDEPVSANRLRQITQCDADIIGATIKDEAEILAMTSKIFKELGINSEIYVNNRKLINEILGESGIKENYREQVIREIDKIGKISEKEVVENLKKCKADKILAIFKKPESYFKKYKSYSEIEELKGYCDMYGTKINFQPSLARGLSYYNGAVFEIRTMDMKESIGGGGSYIVNGIQATGISFGLERLSSLAKIKPEEKRVVVISIAQDRKAIELVSKLRKEDIPAVLMYKVTNALEYANSSKIPYVIFIGEEEIKKKKFKLRDMKSGKEKFLNETELLKAVKE